MLSYLWGDHWYKSWELLDRAVAARLVVVMRFRMETKYTPTNASTHLSLLEVLVAVPPPPTLPPALPLPLPPFNSAANLCISRSATAGTMSSSPGHLVCRNTRAITNKRTNAFSPTLLPLLLPLPVPLLLPTVVVVVAAPPAVNEENEMNAAMLLLLSINARTSSSAASRNAAEGGDDRGYGGRG